MAELNRTLSVHIGVASGQVVAGGIGSASHREYTVTRDTVNLASRLTEAAAADQILISEPVRYALADRLDCHKMGALSVKGFVQPVPIWQPPRIGRSSAAAVRWPSPIHPATPRWG